MVDLNTFLTTLYVMTDTFCTTLPVVAQPGPDASLSRSEVLTLALGGHTRAQCPGMAPGAQKHTRARTHAVPRSKGSIPHTVTRTPVAGG